MKCTRTEGDLGAIWRRMFDRRKEDKSGKAGKLRKYRREAQGKGS